MRWKAPDILVIGWIPGPINPPPTAAYLSGLASTLLFQSANPDPPVSFPGFSGFANWIHPENPIGTKEYRAAAYLEGVEAEFPDDGSPPQVYRKASRSYIGYTPLRLIVGGVNVAATFPQFAQYKKGTGPPYAPTSARDPAGTWVEIRYRAEFKLSWLTNTLSRLVTGAWAPYAWCEIVCRFERAGHVRIHVDGSAIPSQRLYINWVLPKPKPKAGILPEFDMKAANPAEVTGFLQTAGWGCQPAPGATRLAWHGPAST